MSRGCRRGSANVVLAFAGPASPPPLWTAAPLMPLIKDLRNMPAACPELIVPSQHLYVRTSAASPPHDVREENAEWRKEPICMLLWDEPCAPTSERGVDSQSERSRRGY